MSETQYTNIIEIITNKSNFVSGNQFTEAAIMSKIFKNNNNDDSFYILEDKRGDPLQNYIKFYNRYMTRYASVNIVTAQDTNIMDLDISPMMTQIAIKYLFFLDLLSEIYYGYQKNSSSILVKCRYFIDEGSWKLYTRSDFYSIYLDINLPSKQQPQATYNIRDISVVQNKELMIRDVKSMFELFSHEIIRHIAYLGKKDIQQGQPEYLSNIQGFYKFCRLKIMYYAIKSIPDAQSNYKNMFIDTQLIYLFLNLKNDIAMKNPGYQNVSVTNKLLVTKKKLTAINDETVKTKEMMRKNAMHSKKIKESYNRQLLYVCLALTLVFTLTTFLVLNLGGLTEEKTSQVSLLIIIITVCVYITIYYILYISNVKKEYFEAYGFDKVFQFPLEPPTALTKNQYYYANNRLRKQIRIFGSSQSGQSDFWKAFDRNIDTYWESANNLYTNGRSIYTYRNSGNDSYDGEYLQIDLNENVILKYFTISFIDNIKAPKNFRLYGSKKSDTVVNTAPVPINDISWKPLIDVKNMKYPAVTKRRIDLSQTHYDKYMYPQQIAAGRNFSVVIDKSKNVRAFGLNSRGQLGIGSINKQFYPQLVLLQESRTLKNIIQVSAGGFHTLFLTNEGYAYSCGENQWGQLGDSTNTNRYYPVDVRSSSGTKLTNVVQVCAGHTHSMFLKVNKTVVGCGRNKNGQLGNGTSNDRNLPTTPVIDNNNRILSNVIQVAGGVYSFATFFLRSDGTVYKCGVFANPNVEAEPNNDSIPQSSMISILDDVTVKISAAGGFCLGVTDNNLVWGIGQNKFNQLGYANYNPRSQDSFLLTNPVYVHTNVNNQKILLTDIIDVAAGTSHSIFLKSNGSVMACGKNTFGQLGFNDINDVQYPTVVPSLNNVFQIAAGDNHSMFLIMNSLNSIIKTCGYNGDGQTADVERTTVWMSKNEECYSCQNTQDIPKFNLFLTKTPRVVKTIEGLDFTGPEIPANTNSQTMTFLNNFESTMYTNNINDAYRHYALVIHSLVGNSALANRAQISEWELFGTYKDQTTYLATQYQDIYNTRTSPLNEQIANFTAQKAATSNALEAAIRVENEKYALWQALVQELTKDEYKIEGIVIPPNMDINYYQNELPKLQQIIDTAKLDAVSYGLRAASSNTEFDRVNYLNSALLLQNTQLQTDISILSGQYESFKSYKTVIDGLMTTIGTATVQNNGVISEQQKTVIQSRIDETTAAIRLGAAQNANSIKQIELRQKENLVFSKANDLANAKLEADRQVTLLQNEINTRQSILQNISKVTAVDADVEAEKIKRLEAERELVIAKSITEGTQIMAQSMMDIAEDAKKLSDELQGILMKRTENVRDLRNKTKGLLSEMKDLDDRIASIETDTNMYVSRVEKDAQILQARREREKKWLEYQISNLQTTFAEVDASVRQKIEEYQQSMQEDQEIIDDLMLQIQSKSEEIAQIVIERQRYKYIANAVAVDASVVTIQTKILYNINNTATVIANSIVLTGMDKEYRELDEQKDKVQLLEVKSGNDVEINKRDDKIIFATNKLLLNIMLAAVILIIIYNKYVSIYVVIFMILVFCIMIAFYFIEVLHIVRTFGSKYYWQTGLPKEFTDVKKN